VYAQGARELITGKLDGQRRILERVRVIEANAAALYFPAWRDVRIHFGELPNGICRIAAPLTHELALTLPHWRECLRYENPFAY